MSLWQYANPRKFVETTDRVLPYITVLAALTLAVGLIWGFFFTGDERRMGASVKILFIHVPTAMMAINAWIMMLVASLVWLIRRHHVSALAAKAAAPVGMVLTLLAIITGALWGQPTWGTWWVWDPRLTSFLILLLFYFGYMALWEAVESPDTAADLTAALCLVGSVFAVLSRYAALFWAQGQHQGASLSLDRQENMDDVFWLPLLFCLAGFVLMFVALVLARTRTEVKARRLAALERLQAEDN